MVCRRRSAQAVSSQGQKSSSWVYSGGTRSKNLRRALWHLERLQVSARARRRMQKETYSVRSRWHISSTLQALAASRQRFTWVTSFSEPGGQQKMGMEFSARLPSSCSTPWRPCSHPVPARGHLRVVRMQSIFVPRVPAGPKTLSLLTFPKRCPGHTTNLMPQNLLQTPTLNKIKLFSTFSIL